MKWQFGITCTRAVKPKWQVQIWLALYAFCQTVPPPWTWRLNLPILKQCITSASALTKLGFIIIFIRKMYTLLVLLIKKVFNHFFKLGCLEQLKKISNWLRECQISSLTLTLINRVTDWAFSKFLVIFHWRVLGKCYLIFFFNNTFIVITQNKLYS